MNIDIPRNDDYTIPFDHVSDRAYLVAAYRLAESKRPDRYFNDHLAAKLLGSKHDEILSRLSVWKMGEWTMTVRTTLIDRLLQKWIEQGIDTVVNLAAGLDTRPYRLALPKNLNWIEADFKEMIEYKNTKLKDEEPACRLQRVAVNLADPGERAGFFSTFESLGNFVILTEGLLLYLEPFEVQGLSRDLLLYPNLKAWITDITTAQSFRGMQNFASDKKEGENALIPERGRERGKGTQVHFKFMPNEGIRYFEPLGWRVQEFVNFHEYGKLINRNLDKDMQPFDPSAFVDVGIGVLGRKA